MDKGKVGEVIAFSSARELEQWLAETIRSLTGFGSVLQEQLRYPVGFL